MLPRLGVISAATLAAALAVSAQEQDPLRTHYERAQSFQLAGELERAATEYRAEVLPRALRRLGNLEGAEGRFATALTTPRGFVCASATVGGTSGLISVGPPFHAADSFTADPAARHPAHGDRVAP